MFLSLLDPHVLMDTRQFLDAAVEQYEVVQQLDDAVLIAHFQQILV